jgi:putative ATPase
MPSLWHNQHQSNRQAVEPLAVRMRPRTLEDFVGQQHFLGSGKLLRRMLAADRLISVIFYGPPGSGKTSLAEVIALHTKRRFESASAAEVGVAEVRHTLDLARQAAENDRTRTIFFLDEIHRFTRSQQDVLLGDVEKGLITLIGATTENPFFAVNAPLVSRSQIFQFEPLTEQHIATLIRRAIADPDRGYGKLNVQITDDALTHWANICDGDARRALTALEVAVLSAGKQPQPTATPSSSPNPTGNPHPILIDLDTAEQSIQRKALAYDHTGDQHYDCASAFIKSMRGSDPDAAVYWLARMLVAGEDPRFIARRIAILASEDIGNADPRALSVAAAAYDITERVGLPECQLTLAQAAIYMATAPKSNASALAIGSATEDVKHQRSIPVPRHLRDGHYPGANQLGNAQNYQYVHNSPTGYIPQDYLGVDKTYYTPTHRGYEKQIADYLQYIIKLNADNKTT